MALGQAFQRPDAGQLDLRRTEKGRPRLADQLPLALRVGALDHRDADRPTHQGDEGDEEFGSVEVNGVVLQDSNPLVTRNALGQLLLTFFKNGNDDDLGIGISLGGIDQPGQYMLTNVGGFDTDDTNWVLYGRFEPETAWSTGPNHAVLVDVLRISEGMIEATFQGELMDLNLGGTGAQAGVMLRNGSFRAEIEDLESSFGAYDLDGLRIEDPLAYSERGDGQLFIDIEQ